MGRFRYNLKRWEYLLLWWAALRLCSCGASKTTISHLQSSFLHNDLKLTMTIWTLQKLSNPGHSIYKIMGMETSTGKRRFHYLRQKLRWYSRPFCTAAVSAPGPWSRWACAVVEPAPLPATTTRRTLCTEHRHTPVLDFTWLEERARSVRGMRWIMLRAWLLNKTAKV